MVIPLEKQIIDWINAHLPDSPCLSLGIGDDAAIIQLKNGRLKGECLQDSAEVVVTTDMLTDGVDFLLGEVDPMRVGHKALGVNLSDLAAMAAKPLAVVVSVVLPQDGAGGLSGFDLAVALYRGMLPLAEQMDVAIAGGDTNTWEGPLAISITALGTTTKHGPLARSGALPGDQLLVTGLLGGSILGRHLDVQPRVREALLLHDRYELHAGIDVSDGLALDTSRLAEASGCGAAIVPAAIPISPAAVELAKQDGLTPLEHALGDGEDFELVLAVPPDAATDILKEQPLDVPITRIGEIIAEKGLWQRTDRKSVV